MTNKMTQKDFYKEIIALAQVNGREDIVEFAKGRIEMLDKKKSGSKPTKTQEENVKLKEIILDVLSNRPKSSTI